MKIDLMGAKLTWASQQIITELERQSVEAQLIKPKYISYDIQSNGDNIQLFYQDKQYHIPNICLVRGGFGVVVKAQVLLLINVLEKLGCTIVNHANSFCYDKVYAATVFALNNIPHPRTLFLNDESLLDRIDFSPVIVKPNRGYQGKGIWVTDKFTEITKFKNDYEFCQQYFKQGSTDFRVVVVGDKALGAMQRTAANNECRSNVALGASTKAVKLTPEMEDIAIRSVKALGYDLGGVDLIQDEIDPNKYYVIEVNRSPDFKAFTEATGINVAKEIADYLIAKIK